MSEQPELTAIGKYILRRLARMTGDRELDELGRALALRRLLMELFERTTELDNLHFSTVYARISYAVHKYQLDRQLVYHERRFRRARPQQLNEKELNSHLSTGYRLLTDLTVAICGIVLPEGLKKYRLPPFPDTYRNPEVQKHFYELRVLVVEIDTPGQYLRVAEEERPEVLYRIPYGQPELADSLVEQACAIIRNVVGLYGQLNLIGAELREGDLLYPTQIVIEPDFLVSVTDVAACFGSGPRFQPWSSLSRRLIPFEKRPAVVRGNIVNSFLDVLVHDPEKSFRALLPTIFATQPLELCRFDDGEVRQLVEELKHHFLTVRKFVVEELPKLAIEREAVLLEPTFYSPSYGLQGRLDLLQSQRDTEGGTTSIVELKTSKIFAPNRHGIRSENFIQTLLYDLIINRALGKDANVRSYILYSIDYDRPIRYAPPEFSRQLEAIAARNQLLAVELLLGKLGGSPASGPAQDLRRATDKLFDRLQPERFPGLGRFTADDHRQVLQTYAQLDDLERRYLGAFLGFIAREQRLAKTGEQKSERTNGLASLWLDERADKLARFDLLDGLVFQHYGVENNVLTLRRTGKSSGPVKFRQGDIVVLYGNLRVEAQPEDTLQSQLFKSTIVTVESDIVKLRPRSAQLSDRAFQRYPYWSVERDVLDSSFKKHYLGMYAWAAATPELRRRWLGLEPPGRAINYPWPLSPTLTSEQNKILQRIITAPDYFLLWGPPGTGKTSQMLHHLVRHLLGSRENLLLIAYTNRAVDEICESIERIEWPEGRVFRDYLRIGSRFGTDQRFQDRLLQLRSQGITNRRELKEMIDGCRVVVGTVASVGGNHELFALKSFDRIIVDEASQIPEPLLAGILPRAPRALLIGDHRQLPAVVQQSKQERHVYDSHLKKVGLTDLGTSLFERLFITAKRKEWHWAYDQLSYQGRMHREIMAFPALHFYDGQLDILPAQLKQIQRQTGPLTLQPRDELQRRLSSQRLVFISAAADHGTPDLKVNRHEAELLLRLIRAFTGLYARTERPLQPGDIGIITPYRAQIAHVTEYLMAAGLDPTDYTVDTVERYQGSAKRIVLLSLCTNDLSQLATLSQLSFEGVDRKLNVAMTRAREHLVLIGCPDILRESPVYTELLDFLQVVN